MQSEADFNWNSQRPLEILMGSINTEPQTHL